MAVANNADSWADPRQNIFFTADTDNTLRDGNLTGQCVSLTKWFLAEMTNVPNPAAARGHAKDVGDRLVIQGHAVQVAEGNRKRGDFVVWKQDGGGYGHIGVLLSGDRVFEQNVGLAGTQSKLVNGQRVYASRIDPLYQSWRKGAPTFYRINSYQETGGSSGGNNTMTPNFIRRTYYMVNDQTPTQAEVDFHMAKSNPESFMNGFGDNPLWKIRTAERDAELAAKNAVVAENVKIAKENTELKAQVKKLQDELANGGGESGEFTKVLTSGADLYIKK